MVVSQGDQLGLALWEGGLDGLALTVLVVVVVVVEPSPDVAPFVVNILTIVI